MREFGNPLGDRPPLDELARTDLLLDALAEREEVDFADPRDDALAALLGQWRDDLRCRRPVPWFHRTRPSPRCAPG